MSNFSLTHEATYASKSRSLFSGVSYRYIGLVAAVCDVLLILIASWAAGAGYHAIILEIEGSPEAFLAVGTYCATIYVLISALLGLYRPSALLSARSQIRGVFLAWCGAILAVTSILFLLKAGANYSRGATAGFGILGFCFVLLSRALTGINLQRATANGTLAGPRVILIGDPGELASKSPLKLLRFYGAREVARFELSESANDGDAGQQGDALNVVDAAIAAARALSAEQIVLALRWVDVSRRDLICERLQVLPLPVLLLPDQFVGSIIRTTDEFGSGAPIELQRAPLSDRDLVVKRLFDVVVAGMCLFVLSPILLMVGLAIKFGSPGPAIFRQRRKGFNGSDFEIWKFRTMTVMEDGPIVRQARINDDRVTWIGRLLRASSIDELPQLLNVLAGQMSLVGPRPHALAHDLEYSGCIDKYAFRHHVKPGITGWAQVHGYRGETRDPALMDKRVKYDLWYVNNWSLWLDIRIMAHTCVEVLRRRNAY